jgi:putative transcriptional regulator
MPMASRPSFLDGQFLIAMPNVEESTFSKAVVYLCAHSEDGAMGLIINKPMAQLTFRELLVQLDIVEEDDRIQLPPATASMRVHRGGPVETGRGFVLHTSDYHLENSTLPIDEGISLTATLEVLKAIADGRGPEHAMLALGYAGWGPGQLESEIQANGWLTSTADHEIIFDMELDIRYTRALAMLGIDPALLSSESGHA